MEISTETLSGKTTDQLSKYEFITIDPDQLISKVFNNSSKCNFLAKSSEELVEINVIFHQTIGNTIVHNQTDKSSNSSEMQSSKKLTTVLTP